MTRTRVIALFLALGLAGCGLGAGSERGGAGAQLRVTRDFGRTTVTSASLPRIRSSDTVMRFLQAHAKTTTRYGGGFVQSIDGIAGNSKAGRHDWFYFVNGVEAPSGAADRALAPGDVVQWDYRRWDASPRVPAIVGAFPEPFLHGQKGTRYPTRIECAQSTNSCDTVQSKLEDVGVAAGSGALGSEARGGVLRVEATIFVERDSQKGIIIGKQGNRLKQIGQAARREIERLLNAHVYLALWVKVRKDWSEDEQLIRDMGYA